jgi:MFS family permease
MAHDTFRTSVDGLGLLLTAFGAGTLAGALTAGSLDQRTTRMRVALTAGAAAGIGWAVLGATSSLAFAVTVLIVVGGGLGVLNVLFFTQVQALAPPRLLGRVMGVQLLGSMGLQPVAFLVAGWAVDRVGIPPVFLAGGALVAGTCLAMLPSWR